MVTYIHTQNRLTTFIGVLFQMGALKNDIKNFFAISQKLRAVRPSALPNHSGQEMSFQFSAAKEQRPFSTPKTNKKDLFRPRVRKSDLFGLCSILGIKKAFEQYSFTIQRPINYGIIAILRVSSCTPLSQNPCTSNQDTCMIRCLYLLVRQKPTICNA